MVSSRGPWSSLRGPVTFVRGPLVPASLNRGGQNIRCPPLSENRGGHVPPVPPFGDTHGHQRTKEKNGHAVSEMLMQDDQNTLRKWTLQLPQEQSVMFQQVHLPCSLYKYFEREVKGCGCGVIGADRCAVWGHLKISVRSWKTTWLKTQTTVNFFINLHKKWG